MLRCLVVDDEEYAIKIIVDYINKVPFLTLAGTTSNAIDALYKVQNEGVDLLFLDIQMPEITGIQFLELYGQKCQVILTTAYPEYALDGFEYGVVDYLLKPIPFERFLKAIQKIELKEPLYIENENSSNAINNIIPSQEYFFVKGGSKNKYFKINYDDVFYIEGLKNYISIVTKDQKVVTYQSLRETEQQLPHPPFYRIHKSYIISINKVQVIDDNLVHIYDKQIPIGKTYRALFYKKIKDI